MSNAIDVEALREAFVGEVFDEIEVTLDAEETAAYAASCGELSPCFTDPTHPDFQAPPTLPASIHSGRRRPKGFPKMVGLGMDAGKAVHCHLPIRTGVKLTAKTHMHDIYAKTGRSGRMVFFVNRMEIFDPDGQLLASADSSSVIRERPEE